MVDVSDLCGLILLAFFVLLGVAIIVLGVLDFIDRA
jgi:hypothetical protein